MMLGNLTVKEMEARLGVEFPEDLVSFMEGSQQQEANNIKSGKWHCFDIPFHLVCGDMETAKKIHSSLAPLGPKMKRQLPISLQK